MFFIFGEVLELIDEGSEEAFLAAWSNTSLTRYSNDKIADCISMNCIMPISRKSSKSEKKFDDEIFENFFTF